MNSPTKQLLTDIFAFGVRTATPDDLGYIIDSWGRSLRSEYQDARTSDFVDSLKGYINACLLAGDEIYIAHPVDEPTVIWGWVCTGPQGVIRFIYVRSSARRASVATRLVHTVRVAQGLDPAAELVTTSRLTEVARAIKSAHPDRIRYVPHL